MTRQQELAVIGGTSAVLLGLTLGLLVWVNIPSDNKKSSQP
jgi:hypothetical protein